MTASRFSPQLRVSFDYLRMPSHAEDRRIDRARRRFRADRRFGTAACAAWRADTGSLGGQVWTGSTTKLRRRRAVAAVWQSVPPVAKPCWNPSAQRSAYWNRLYKDLRLASGGVRQRKMFANDGPGARRRRRAFGSSPLWHGLWGVFGLYGVAIRERRDHPDDPWRLFRFDQTHILTAVLTYELPWGLTAGRDSVT